MRILKEFDTRGIKCTVFSWNGKISVKCEKDLLEQIYKFRDGSGLYTPDDAELFLDDSFFETVEQCFAQMASIRFGRCKTLQESKGLLAEFDVII